MLLTIFSILNSFTFPLLLAESTFEFSPFPPLKPVSNIILSLSINNQFQKWSIDRLYTPSNSPTYIQVFLTPKIHKTSENSRKQISHVNNNVQPQISKMKSWRACQKCLETSSPSSQYIFLKFHPNWINRAAKGRTCLCLEALGKKMITSLEC